MSFSHLDQIVGQRIAGVVVKSGSQSPLSQVFLVFDDGSVYEFYSGFAWISGTWMNKANGMETALSYMPTRAIIEQHPKPD